MNTTELEEARARKDWAALWPEAHTRANFSIEQLAHNATDPDSKDYDPDVCQVGYEAAWLALETWEPTKGTLDTHLKAQVHGALHDHWRKEKTGGIGSAWVSREGNAADHASMQTPTGDDEEGDEMGTWMDNVTYGNTDSVPTGYGSPEQEAGRDTIDDTIAYLLHGLTPEEAELARNVIMGEISQVEYAAITGDSQPTVHRRTLGLIKNLNRKAKSSYVLSKGIQNWKGLQSHFPVRKRYPHFWSDAEGMFTANPIWSEATGRVWNDWAYLCDDPTSLPEMETMVVQVAPYRVYTPREKSFVPTPEMGERNALLYGVGNEFERDEDAAWLATDKAAITTARTIPGEGSGARRAA